ncbi:hypothetical protein C5E45_33085 [Nocardia nova]|uniref:Uncharacterized protein n=1 Tax=Nocardia nova TaxID=37330 RepID=A0A2S6ACK8_9NOCA|nr:ESX-1 secretion-associated protein [Nocardia nova]PPJ19685.1 hypothetical protein C5E41_30825 [Nocardia nova]PPJ31828.1 hypothetical protein C5E45_33085 [Nocardia nova]
MPEMEIDPAVLRQLAEQHRQVARETRAWAEPPHEWLASFIPTYGKIAQPVKDALDGYYDARKRAGDKLADDHDHTADQLIAAAEAYENADHGIASDFRRAGDDIGGHGSPQGTPAHAAPNGRTFGSGDGRTPLGTSPLDGGPSVTGPQTPGTGQQQPDAADQSPDAPVPGVAAAAPGAAAPMGAVDSTGNQAGSGSGVNTGAAAATAGTPAGGVTTPVTAGAGVGADDRSAQQPPTGATGRYDLPPVPIVTPFAAAVAAAKDKEAEPAYVVGDAVDNDLLVARTLLAAVLAAADTPAVGMHWAVGVMRGPAGAGVFITSNEGRGWLPAGIYLPREVSTPWLWDEMLADGSGSAASPWEGISDPARVLVEFGLAWGPKANASLVALASSASIDGELRARLPDIAMADLVGPAYDVDLRVHTPDTVDRLDLAGSPDAATPIAAVPDSRAYARCLELVTDAHTRLVRSGTASADSAESRRIRDRILAVLEAGQEVSPQWWEQLREADDLLAAAMLSRRVDVARVAPGDLRIDAEGATLRAMVFERRCNELLLLLAGEPGRQQLRDAAYAYDQIVNHPQFVEVPVAVTTSEAATVDRSVTVAGPVSAPGVTAGPPGGAAVAPPVVAPPAVTPPSEQS